MYSLKRKPIVLHIVDLFASKWHPHFLDTVTDKISLYLKACILSSRDTSTKRTTIEMSTNILNCY